MKLTDLIQDDKLSLDLTPLIDIVFLLVLFFAVTTSFISPENLEKLKATLLDYQQQKDDLEIQKIDLTADIRQYKSTLLDLEIAAEKAKLGQHQQESFIDDLQNTITQKVTTISQLESDVDATSSSLDETANAVVQLQTKLSDEEEEQLALRLQLTDLEAEKIQLLADLANRDLALRTSEDESSDKKNRILGLLENINTLERKVISIDEEHDKTVIDLQELLSKSQAENKISDKERLALQVELEGHLAQLAKDKKENEQLFIQLTDAIAQSSKLEEELVEEHARSNRFQEIIDLRSKENDALKETVTRIADDLSDELGVKQVQDRVIINLPDNVLFDSGSASVKDKGKIVLNQVGQVLKGKIGQMKIQVGGHTDNVPLSRAQQTTFKDNWDLSTARAVNVVRFLQTSTGLDASKLSAAGYAYYRPIADNATDQGKKQNRRIEIVLLPE
jgi:chemotaxis protein MotB